MPAYPLLIDLTHHTILIVGGGAVAARKARGLLDAGATVRCVAPTFHADLPPAVVRLTGRYDASLLAGMTLVFAATNDPAVNTSVVRDARLRHILVQRADTDDTDPGDFTTPAVHRDGDVTLTVSAGGSPSLAKVIRDDLASKIDPRHLRMATALRTLRPMILNDVPDSARRAQIFRDLTSNEALDLLARDGEPALHAWVRGRY